MRIECLSVSTYHDAALFEEDAVDCALDVGDKIGTDRPAGLVAGVRGVGRVVVGNVVDGSVELKGGVRMAGLVEEDAHKARLVLRHHLCVDLLADFDHLLDQIRYLPVYPLLRHGSHHGRTQFVLQCKTSVRQTPFITRARPRQHNRQPCNDLTTLAK